MGFKNNTCLQSAWKIFTNYQQYFTRGNSVPAITEFNAFFITIEPYHNTMLPAIRITPLEGHNTKISS